MQKDETINIIFTKSPFDVTDIKQIINMGILCLAEAFFNIPPPFIWKNKRSALMFMSCCETNIVEKIDLPNGSSLSGGFKAEL